MADTPDQEELESGEEKEELSPQEKYRKQLEDYRGQLCTRGISQIINEPNRVKNMLQQKRFELDQLLRTTKINKFKTIQTARREIVTRDQRAKRMPYIRKTLTAHGGRRSEGEMDIPPQKKAFLFSDGLSDKIRAFGKMVEVPDTWFPMVREGGSISSIGNKLYLIGGRSQKIIKEISVFDRRSQAWQREPWSMPLKGRFGHTAVIHGTNIFIWGGMNKFIKQSKTRSCINTVNKISTHTNTIENVNVTGSQVNPRRYHSAALIGTHMIVYGGISDRNVYLDDVLDFDVESGAWSDVYPNGQGPGPLAYHSAIGIYDSIYEGMAKFTPYHYPKMYGLGPSSLKESGVFIFGGMSADGFPSNKLYVIKIGRPSLNWIQPVTQGKPPSKRFLYSMNKMIHINSIAIYGGRSTKAATPWYSFGDLYMLKLTNLMWTKVELFGVLPAPRNAHCAAIVGTRMYIFGGVNAANFCKSDLYHIEFGKEAEGLIKTDLEKRAAERKKTQYAESRRLRNTSDPLSATTRF